MQDTSEVLVCDMCELDSCVLFLFFFSSRRRHTRLQGDWSSDVCSSDLLPLQLGISFVRCGGVTARCFGSCSSTPRTRGAVWNAGWWSRGRSTCASMSGRPARIAKCRFAFASSPLAANARRTTSRCPPQANLRTEGRHLPNIDLRHEGPMHRTFVSHFHQFALL